MRHRGGTSKENYATIISQSELKHSHEAQSNGFEERRGWKRESKINSSQAQRIAFSYGVGNFNLLEDREFIKVWTYLKLCLKLLRKGIIKSTLRNSSNIKRERNIYIELKEVSSLFWGPPHHKIHPLTPRFEVTPTSETKSKELNYHENVVFSTHLLIGQEREAYCGKEDKRRMNSMSKKIDVKCKNGSREMI